MYNYMCTCVIRNSVNDQVKKHCGYFIYVLLTILTGPDPDLDPTIQGKKKHFRTQKHPNLNLNRKTEHGSYRDTRI